MSNDIEKLVELIINVVDGPGTWREKRASVVAEAEAGGTVTLDKLNEFVTWFNGDIDA